MNWVSAVLSVFPNANGVYRAALVNPLTQQALMNAGILESPKRIAAFFATVGIESAGMTALRENMNYSKAQILKVFGVGRHSAGITDAEAANLVRNPEALAERVYGLGNPRKARELGNNRKGDGFAFRGIGPFQNTGRAQIEELMRRIQVSQIEDLLKPANLFAGAIYFWADRDLGAVADRGDTRNLRRLVNGGYNGYDDFKVMYDALLKALGDEGKAVRDSSTVAMQQALQELGYSLSIDGVYGAKTKNAVIDFQKKNNLKADGIAGPATWAVIDLRIETKSPVEPPAVPVISDQTAAATGGGALGLGVIGETIMGISRELGLIEIDSPFIRAIPPILLLIGLGLTLYPQIRNARYGSAS